MTRRKVILPYWSATTEGVISKDSIEAYFGNISQGELIIGNGENGYLATVDRDDNVISFDSTQSVDNKIHAEEQRAKSVEEALSGTLETILNMQNGNVDGFKSLIEDINELSATTSALTIEISNKQDTLVSGVTIKTINGFNILGDGNIDVITDLSDYYTKQQINDKIDKLIESI